MYNSVHVFILNIPSLLNFTFFFQVVYQRILQLSYVDKLLDQLQLAFRDKYKNELTRGELLPMSYSGFGDVFKVCLWGEGRRGMEDINMVVYQLLYSECVWLAGLHAWMYMN